ncbi:hypothetical protein EG028_02750 [Chitinophaga barathri]|uniref:BZIP transcription factor n=2 Tax=Chitinophaga barathri TaxID=1647451 RepID=A0A3N4N6H1_9BACT|nr:hypothetical protein EG028_02750 [Chitinophaga barathri]
MKMFSILLIQLFFSISTFAQNHFPSIGNASIGAGTNPPEMLSISGPHTTTRMELKWVETGNPLQGANMYLWASEPGVSYSGVGIGNNAYNGPGGITRKITQRGSSYIRLLDQFIYMNLIDIYGNNKNAVMIDANANMGIGGNAQSAYKLSVHGVMSARKIKVTQETWADHVFQKDYQLPTLAELDAYIKTHHHLPAIPSAEEVKSAGLDVGDMQAKLLQKVEELTLYLIEERKRNEALEERVKALENRTAARQPDEKQYR